MNRAAVVAASLAALFIMMPAPTYAANATFLGPIVPAECKCDNQQVKNADGSAAGQTVTTAPDYGCVLQVVQNSVNFGITLSTIIFVLYLVLTGFAFMTSGGSSEARSKAKTRFMNVFIGLAVLLCAWLIVDYVMKTVYDDGKFGPWNAILAGQTSDRCIVAKNPSSITTGTIGIVTGNPGNTAAAGGTGTSGMNTVVAASYAASHAASSSTGSCALYVRKALAAGGLTSFNTNHPASAYQYGPYLTGAGFSQVASGTYSPSIEGTISGLQAGDVVVFQPVSGHKDGHIAIYTGSQWVSDYRQSTMSSNPSDYNGGSYTIYRP